MFLYKVNFWDEIDKTSRNIRGFTSASTWAEAIDRIVSLYGKDYVVEVTLSELDDTLDEGEITEIFED